MVILPVVMMAVPACCTARVRCRHRFYATLSRFRIFLHALPPGSADL
jgi:hypothetical protein